MVFYFNDFLVDVKCPEEYKTVFYELTLLNFS